MIKYLYDENGNKTDVLVPIEEWEFHKLPVTDNMETATFSFNDSNSLRDIYLLRHYREILELIEKRAIMNKEEWIDFFDEYFKYYHALSEYDISLLFFFRKFNQTSLFASSFDKHTELEKLCQQYNFRTIENEKPTMQQFIAIRNLANYANEFSYLQAFKFDFKIDLPKPNTKRLQRIPDRNRLFTYDLLTIHDLFIKEQSFRDHWDFIKSKKNIITFISEYFYNNQESVIYRLYGEVEERIKLQFN